MTMHPHDDNCSTGICDRPALIRVSFLDGQKMNYCLSCAKKIGGQQTPLAKP